MKIGRVVGEVIATITVPVFEGRKMLVCEILGADLTPSGSYKLAVDSVGAGVGETVLVLDEGNSARQVLQVEDAPVRTVIIGIVDAVQGPDGASLPGL